MSEWREFCLGHISTIVDCEHKTAPIVSESNYLSVRTSNISNGRIDYQNCNRVSQETYKIWSKRLIPKEGDIVLAREAPVGEVGIITKNQTICLGQRTVLIRANNDFVHDKYLLYYLVNKETKYDLISHSTGSVVEHINIKDLKKFRIKIHADASEQKAIASVLSSLDDKIDLLHRQNETLEHLAETIFRQWFVEEAQDDSREYALKDVFDIGIGRTPPRNEHHWFSQDPSDVKWISIKDMGNIGVYANQVSEYLTRAAVEEFRIPTIPANTVILSFKMTIGRLAITDEEMVSNEAIAHFKIRKDSKLYSEFLYLYLKTYQWEQLGSTSSIVESINSQMIKNIQIPIPQDRSLLEFKRGIDPFFQKIKSTSLQIRTLTNLRDTLLPKLMSGEIRVKTES
jgi:type I restriction enzyme S subunit